MTGSPVLNYIEFSVSDLDATKAFFTTVFGWEFTDWGPDYADTRSADLTLGFYRGTGVSRQDKGGALAGFYAADLYNLAQQIERAGGEIIKPTYSFPGGERFHFCEPCGNEFICYTVADE